MGVSVPGAGVTLALSGYQDAATPFTVVAKIDKRGNLVRDRQNIVHVESDWVIVHGDADQRASTAAADLQSRGEEAARRPAD